MLNILLADDDQLAIDGVRLLLSRKNYELEIFESKNGKFAQDILREHPIDILFTDIDMPLVNGISLAQEARRLYPNIKIIFFSAYSDFVYAKSAINIGAVSYILKPIQPAEFYAVIDRTIDLCRPREEKTVYEEKEPLDSLLEKRDMELYLSDIFFTCEQELDIALPELPVLAGNPRKTLQLVFLRSNLPLLTAQRNEFDKLLKRITNVPAEFYAISGSYGIAILDISGKKNLILNWDTWWQELKREMTKMNSKLVFLAVRTRKINTMQDILLEMRSVRRLLDLNHYIQETTLIRTEHDNMDHATSFRIEDIVEDMQGIIMRREFHLLSEKLHILISAVIYNHSYSALYVKHILLNLVQDIEKQVPDEYVATLVQVKRDLLEISSLTQSEELLQNMLQELEEMQNRQFSNHNHHVRKIQSIIMSDYAADIDLNFLADRVGLSVTYMCNLFKKETGISIGQYIKNVRMEKAKELLSDVNLRLNDIYPQVGYSSLTYFCIAFKENFGMTPTQFRQQKMK